MVQLMPLPPKHLLHDPDWFNLAGAGLPKLSWKNRPLNVRLSRMTRVSQYQQNIHSLTPCLCGYYTTSLI